MSKSLIITPENNPCMMMYVCITEAFIHFQTLLPVTDESEGWYMYPAVGITDAIVTDSFTIEVVPASTDAVISFGPFYLGVCLVPLGMHIQLTLVISTLLISNKHLSRSENLVPV